MKSVKGLVIVKNTSHTLAENEEAVRSICAGLRLVPVTREAERETNVVVEFPLTGKNPEKFAAQIVAAFVEAVETDEHERLRVVHKVVVGVI